MVIDQETSERFSKAFKEHSFYEDSDQYYLERALTARVLSDEGKEVDFPVAVYIKSVLDIVGKDIDFLKELIEIVSPTPVRTVTDFRNAKPRGLANRS